MIFLCNAQEKFYFCTAADAKYFEPLLNLIGGIHKNDFNRLGEIAIFDLGLTQEQCNELQTIEKVTVYDVELTHPDLLKLFNTQAWGKLVPGWYAWKPVVIKQALDMFPYVLWIDAGTTVYRSLEDLFGYIKEHGYFFHNGCDWHIARETTAYIIDKFNLNSPEKSWILDQKAMEAGLMGFDHRVYDAVVLPMYTLAKNLRNFKDDGSAPGGFGDARYEQSLFSIYVVSLGYHIFHHFEQPKKEFYLDFKGKNIPFHIACTPWDKTDNTHVYCSRHDTNLKFFKPFIKYKEKW